MIYFMWYAAIFMVLLTVYLLLCFRHALRANIEIIGEIIGGTSILILGFILLVFGSAMMPPHTIKHSGITIAEDQ